MEDKIPKIKRLSKRKLMESALKAIEKDTGLTVIDVSFGDGYFLFDYGKDTVCWFKIKEIPKYRFALWNINNVNRIGYGPEYTNAELIFFTQHELTIDKFKPSRSAFRAPLERFISKPNDSDVYSEEWWTCEVTSIIEFIKEHKYRAFHIQSYSGWGPCDYISGPRAFYNYINTHWYYWKENLKEKIMIKKVSRDVIKTLKGLDNIKAILSDYGDSCSPRLHLFFYEKYRISEEESLKNQDVFDYLTDKYFKELSTFYVGKAEKFKSILNHREKSNGKGETLIWKKI